MMSLHGPETDLDVAMLGIDPAAGRVADNLAQAEAMIEKVRKGTGLIVLPELFNSTFQPDRDAVTAIAETNDGPTMKAVEEWARRTGAAIWGSFTAKDCDRYFNRGFMARPDGPTEFYDKRHLFMGTFGEGSVFSPGGALAPTVNVGSWRLRMAICYDVRFPVWNRAVECDYDALIVPANWPSERGYPWRQMLIARAIENQTYVVGANRTGHDRSGDFTPDGLVAYDNWGREVSDRSCQHETGIVYAHMDAARLVRDRERFAPWRDADTFSIEGVK